MRFVTLGYELAHKAVLLVISSTNRLLEFTLVLGECAVLYLQNSFGWL